MADVFSASKRSEVMSKIRGKNTKAEVLTFRYLRKEGVYFQKHYRRAPGNPDIALPRRKKAVFIDGDFWHGKTIQTLTKQRGSDDYWVQKINRNIERDKSNEQKLLDSGWTFIRIEEKDILRKGSRMHALEAIKRYLLLHEN